MLIIDFETRSNLDVTVVGPYIYATHESTEIICMAWGIANRDETPTSSFKGVWHPGEKLPTVLISYAQATKAPIGAFNAAFERLIWENCMPDDMQVPLNRWYCIAAQMRVNALPSNLFDAGRAVFGFGNKDPRGAVLIKRLCSPGPDGEFNKDPALLQEMDEYCEQDVVATRDVFNSTREMTSQEIGFYHNSEQINDDGIMVDIELAEMASEYAGVETDEIGLRLTHLTDGYITRHTQLARIRSWLFPHLNPDQYALTQVAKKGEIKSSFDSSVRAALLERDDLPPDLREVIEMVDAANKSSVAKFKRMVERADHDDHRVRGSFLYAGASQTLRFASRGLQLHNFARDCLTPQETIQLKIAMLNDQDIPDVMRTLSKALRPTLTAEKGCRYVVGDWSAIEARALPWLSDHPRAQERLDYFAASDEDPDLPDLYTRTSDELNLGDRQIGKVAELSLGYGGATGAFNAMAKNYGVKMLAHEVEVVVSKWRGANVWAVDFWDSLEMQAKRAISNPLKPQVAGRVSYTFYPALIGGTLVCTLPGGGMIQYPRARLEQQETKVGLRTVITAMKANFKPAKGQKEWPRVTLWRGLLAENVTQAFCAFLLNVAIDDCLKDGIPIVAHVHDELVAEVVTDETEEVVHDMEHHMTREHVWAKGLPLKAKPNVMRRYGK